MFVKMYVYHIDPEKEPEFLELQKETERIYRQYIDYKTMYLKSRDHHSKWVETHWYSDYETYSSSIDLINQDPNIAKLWKEFNSLLDPNNKEIREEQFDQLVQS